MLDLADKTISGLLLALEAAFTLGERVIGFMPWSWRTQCMVLVRNSALKYAFLSMNSYSLRLAKEILEMVIDLLAVHEMARDLLLLQLFLDHLLAIVELVFEEIVLVEHLGISGQVVDTAVHEGFLGGVHRAGDAEGLR